MAHAMLPLEGLPLVTLTRLLAEAAQEQPGTLAEYLPAEGYPPLRHELARVLAGWGLLVRPAEVLVLSGSQQGIDLLARLFLHPGDYVAMEAHSYPGAHAAFRTAGARLLPVPVDGDGMQIDGLASLLSRYPVRLIYTVPTYQNPTGTTLPLARRLALLDVASRHGVPIIEDSPFEQLYFGQPPPPPLKALDREDRVLYVSSASKILGTGLRLGWLAAPPAIIEQVATLKRSADLQASNLSQVAVNRFLAGGLLDDHLASLRQICRRRAERLQLALRAHLPELTFTSAQGGVYLWARLPDGLSAEAVLEQALPRGLAFMPGSWFSINGSDDGSLRLCFTNLLPPAMLDEGVARLAGALRAVVARGGAPHSDRLVSHVAVV
jgi:DNA-binding transcriptional MocR family regulator